MSAVATSSREQLVDRLREALDDIFVVRGGGNELLTHFEHGFS